MNNSSSSSSSQEKEEEAAAGVLLVSANGNGYNNNDNNNSAAAAISGVPPSDDADHNHHQHSYYNYNYNYNDEEDAPMKGEDGNVNHPPEERRLRPGDQKTTKKGAMAGPYYYNKHYYCYKECLKNHAAAIGGNATDGCGEFMPGGEEGTLQALSCSACGCHRNFHRKHTQLNPTAPVTTAHHHQFYSCSSCNCACSAINHHIPHPDHDHHDRLRPHPNSNHNGTILISTTHQKPSLAAAIRSSSCPSSHAIRSSSTKAHALVVLPTTSSAARDHDHRLFDEDGDDGDGVINNTKAAFDHGNTVNNGAIVSCADHDDIEREKGGGVMELRRKRSRTKFTQEQKQKMLSFAEKAGWKLQKQDESVVHHFCQEVGIKRRVLKVWMHNNKNTYAHKSPMPQLINNH